MLAFGLKVVWFSLSLAGFLSSIVALPTFAQALHGYLVPVLYCSTNFILQGLFCLGMIWRMNPFDMPRAFCIVQPALLGVSWSVTTAITAAVTAATSLAILRPPGRVPASPACVRSYIRWHPACLFLIIFPMAAFAAYLALALRFNAIQPADGLHCDATNPVWVRLLSYAGVPLLLALPSLLLTCTAAIHFYIHSTRHNRSFQRPNDHFTPVPLRRQSKFRPMRIEHETKCFDQASGPVQGSFLELSPTMNQSNADQRSMTPSGTIVVAEAIPSPPDSLSSARIRMTVGRAPIKPGVVKPGMRYHLPLYWRTPSPRPSPRPSTDPLRDSPDLSDCRQTPSPLVFAASVSGDDNGAGFSTTTVVSIAPDLSERIYDAAPWLKDEKAYLRHVERAHARKHGNYRDDDVDDDDVSRSLRWVRASNETALTMKSELEFARTPLQEDCDGARRPSPVDPSTYDAALTETPIPNQTRMVWRILFFQLFSSATQILATISSLVDILGRHDRPTPFGTQHIALLLAAWAPAIAFGVRPPWRWKFR